MPPRRTNSVFWTQEEVDLLLKGVEEHGKGNWMKIVEDPKYNLLVTHGKNNVNLKDKYRALQIASEKSASGGSGGGNSSLAPLDESREEYEAEAIVDAAKTEQGTVFLIKWRGYDASDNTWQPETRVKKFAPHLLKSFKV